MRARLELEEERDFLLRSLQDLDRERDAGDIAEADYMALRDSYTGQAAAVLRTLAGEAAPEPVAAPLVGDSDSSAESGLTEGGLPSKPEPTRGRSLRPLLTAGAVLVVAGATGVLVAGAAGERLPGDPASGSIAATGPSSDLQRARQLIGDGKTLEAIRAYDEVLRRDPRHPEALAYRGWLLRLAGRAGDRPELIDKAMEFLDRAVAADPAYPDAHFFRGVILYQDRGDPAGAVPEFRAFLANDPPRAMVAVVEDVLRRALADIARAGQPETQPAQPPPG